MPPKQKGPSYEELIHGYLEKTSDPVPVEQLADYLLSAKPSAARNPRQSIRQKIREAVGRELVFLDTDTVLPLRLAYQGVRFQLALTSKEGEQEIIPAYPFASYLPFRFPLNEVQFLDVSGSQIPFTIKQVNRKVGSIFGYVEEETEYYFQLSPWFRSQKMYYKDRILVTILNWERSLFLLEREPASQHNPALLEQHNRLLADVFFDLLENASQEDIYIHHAVPTAYARFPDKSGYPPDHWEKVIEADERMRADDFSITYIDSRGPLWDLFLADSEPKPRPARPAKLAQPEAKQVYRFKVFLKYRPKLWREIEVQGEQTLFVLDRELRRAFMHDTSDHLSGFWKLVPRGKAAASQAAGKRQPKGRTREVEIGDIYPNGRGGGAKIRLADLELSVGQQFKYVYDFGDWIEHTLTLEAIEAPQSGVKYPRQTAQNKPAYFDCVECKAQGKKETATWFCIDCSNEQQKEVNLCEACLEEKHEDHYADEILY